MQAQLLNEPLPEAILDVVDVVHTLQDHEEQEEEQDHCFWGPTLHGGIYC